MKILQNSDKQLVVSVYEEIIKDLKKTNEYYTRKENCATPVKECDDHDSSYPPTKVKQS